MGFHVYVLRCGDGSLYTGMTNDLPRRVGEHQSGRGGKYTRAHLPVKLVAAWPYPDRGTALSAELGFKRLRRSRKLRIIRGRQPFRGAPFATQAVADVQA